MSVEGSAPCCASPVSRFSANCSQRNGAGSTFGSPSSAGLVELLSRLCLYLLDLCDLFVILGDYIFLARMLFALEILAISSSLLPSTR